MPSTAAKVEREVSKLSPEQLRSQLREDIKWLRESETTREWREMRIGFAIVQIRDEGYWRKWKAGDGDKFKSFTQWLDEDCNVGKRSKIYSLMDVATNLKNVSVEDMVKLGKTKCYELARVGRHKPSALPKVIEYINRAERREEPLSVDDVKQVCANALSGQHLGSQSFKTIEFLVPADAALTVRKALAVMDAQEPVQDPKSSVGMGMLLVKIVTDYLSGKVETQVLKELEKAGAFETSKFRLVE